MTTDADAESRFGTFAGNHGRRGVLVACTLLLIAAAVTLSAATRLTPYVREGVVNALNGRFQSEVELASLQVSAFPRPAVSGAGLSLRHNGRTDVPPLIKIGTYSAGAGLFGLFRSSIGGQPSSIGFWGP